MGLSGFYPAGLSKKLHSRMLMKDMEERYMGEG